MKIFGFSVFTLLLISLFVYWYFKKVIDSIIFKFNILDLDLQNLTLSLFNQGKTSLKIKIEFLIKFLSSLSISISDLNIIVYHENVLVAKSSNEQENFKKIKLIGNIENKINQSFDLIINASLINLIQKITSKSNYVIDYDVSFKILGFIFNYKDKYTNENSKN